MQNRFWSAFTRLPAQTLHRLLYSLSNRLDSVASSAALTLDAAMNALFQCFWKTQDGIAIYVDDIQKYERWAARSLRIQAIANRR